MQLTTLLLLFFAIVGLSGCVTKNPPMIEHRLYVQKRALLLHRRELVNKKI